MAVNPVKAPGKKGDWVTPVALVGGGVMLLGGAYLILKKPPGVKPGGTVKAVFGFDYAEDEGDFVFQVSLGNILVFEPWFDHLPGMTFVKTETIPASPLDSNGFHIPQRQAVEVECPLPAATVAKAYDAEALIRTPSMAEFDYLVKKVTKDAVRVVE